MSAVVVVALSTIAHTAGGAAPPTPAVALLAIVLTLGVIRAAQGEPGQWLRAAGLLLLGQVFFHVAAHAGSGHSGHGGTMPATHLVGHDALHAPAAGLRRTGAAVGPEVVSQVQAALADLTARPGMLAAHVVAAIAAGVWLAAGERAALRLLALTTAALHALFPAVVLVPAAAGGAPVTPWWRSGVCAGRFADAGLRRGPPACAGSLSPA